MRIPNLERKEEAKYIYCTEKKGVLTMGCVATLAPSCLLGWGVC